MAPKSAKDSALQPLLDNIVSIARANKDDPDCVAIAKLDTNNVAQAFAAAHGIASNARGLKDEKLRNFFQSIASVPLSEIQSNSFKSKKDQDAFADIVSKKIEFFTVGQRAVDVIHQEINKAAEDKPEIFGHLKELIQEVRGKNFKGRTANHFLGDIYGELFLAQKSKSLQEMPSKLQNFMEIFIAAEDKDVAKARVEGNANVAEMIAEKAMQGLRNSKDFKEHFKILIPVAAVIPPSTSSSVSSSAQPSSGAVIFELLKNALGKSKSASSTQSVVSSTSSLSSAKSPQNFDAIEIVLKTIAEYAEENLADSSCRAIALNLFKYEEEKKTVSPEQLSALQDEQLSSIYRKAVEGFSVQYLAGKNRNMELSKFFDGIVQGVQIGSWKGFLSKYEDESKCVVAKNNALYKFEITEDLRKKHGEAAMHEFLDKHLNDNNQDSSLSKAKGANKQAALYILKLEMFSQKLNTPSVASTNASSSSSAQSDEEKIIPDQTLPSKGPAA